MKLSEYKTLTRAYIPGAKAQVITNDVLNLILNKGVRDIAGYTACLKANKRFDVEADKAEYELSSVIGDYLTPDKPGLWWNSGTQFVKLNPRTLEYLDTNRPNWKDLGSGTPQDYSIDGDIITLVPAPETTLAEGLWLYYGKNSVDMSKEDDYPFSGSSKEYTHLSVFDDAIINYCTWKINPILNKDQTLDITEAQYKRAREEAYKIFKKRRDIAADSEARLRGPVVR